MSAARVGLSPPGRRWGATHICTSVYAQAGSALLSSRPLGTAPTSVPPLRGHGERGAGAAPRDARALHPHSGPAGAPGHLHSQRRGRADALAEAPGASQGIRDAGTRCRRGVLGARCCPSPRRRTQVATPSDVARLAGEGGGKGVVSTGWGPCAPQPAPESPSHARVRRAWAHGGGAGPPGGGRAAALAPQHAARAAAGRPPAPARGGARAVRRRLVCSPAGARQAGRHARRRHRRVPRAGVGRRAARRVGPRRKGALGIALGAGGVAACAFPGRLVQTASLCIAPALCARSQGDFGALSGAVEKLLAERGGGSGAGGALARLEGAASSSSSFSSSSSSMRDLASTSGRGGGGAPAPGGSSLAPSRSQQALSQSDVAARQQEQLLLALVDPLRSFSFRMAFVPHTGADGQGGAGGGGQGQVNHGRPAGLQPCEAPATGPGRASGCAVGVRWCRAPSGGAGAGGGCCWAAPCRSPPSWS